MDYGLNRDGLDYLELIEQSLKQIEDENVK
jgi:hypothetical protein